MTIESLAGFLSSPLIASEYQRHLQQYCKVGNKNWLLRRLEDSVFARQLQLLWGCSDFVGDQCTSNPDVFEALVDSGDLERCYSDSRYLQLLQPQLMATQNEDQLSHCLRVFRRREMIRIVWRDFTRQASMIETTRDATLLAEACIKGALDILHPLSCLQMGTPISHTGEEQNLVVIAMGKMGAHELNISSDIDLIFAYPESGQTEGGERSISNQEFFVRLGQKLIAALDRQTSHGLVFRVDMRLRPYGQSGALVLNFDALEEYYLTQGREWERYAMIKARMVAGTPKDDRTLHNMLQPFVYRKYLDYGAIESLRDLKRLINRDVSRTGMHDNIKLGEGGIREVEFIVQTLQLIRGGREPHLQTQSLKKSLALLAVDGVIDSAEQRTLWKAYQFLRNTEHALQGIADQQTQQLPDDELGMQRVAVILGYTNWGTFYLQLQHHRLQIRSSFAAIISDPDRASDKGGDPLLDNIWQQATSEDQILHRLQALGYQQPEDIAGKLQTFYSSRAVQALHAVPRGRLEAIMPKLLDVCVKSSNNSITLARVLALIQAVLRRSAYLALLVENPQALEQLALLCERSSWVADELAAYPALLDELLDSRNLYRILDKPALRDQLHLQMLRVDSGDQEQQMESIRYFCRSYTLRVAACEVMDLLPLMQVSDYLTWIAEVVVEHVTHVAWHQLTTTYGSPSPNPDSDIDSRTPGFIVVAYGKMGGIELGYRSDLDLVFLHNALTSHQTDGARQIDNSTFFMRLGQRIIHLLSTSTPSGIAYEIDARLRPSGSSGMLVSTLGAFQKYQQQDAWTWEHQALVRSRVVAGDRNLAAEFNKVREVVLRQPRDAQFLATEVQKMREKMRKHLGQSTKDGKFSLKQGTGGIVDIEFMVQFTVLAWSHAHPLLARWSDNIRILESLAQCGLFTDEESLQLIDAYKNLRTAGHHLQLQKQLDEVPLSAFVVQREIVKTRWNCLMDNN